MAIERAGGYGFAVLTARTVAVQHIFVVCKCGAFIETWLVFMSCIIGTYCKERQIWRRRRMKFVITLSKY
jgi:hypothetical protein